VARGRIKRAGRPDEAEFERQFKKRRVVTRHSNYYYVHFDRIVANLYAFHKVPTADLVAKLWPALLRRCVADDEVEVAAWLLKEHTDIVTVAQLREMHVWTLSLAEDERLHFLSWWAGFLGNPPGMLGGSNSGDSLNSVLHAALAKRGLHAPVGEAMAAMQSAYEVVRPNS
jgi:hypothetical protein